MTIYMGYSKPVIEEFDFISLINLAESSALYDEDESKIEDSGDKNSNDSILRLQYIELIDNLAEDITDDGVISDVDSDDFHGYDGYDEENDIDCGSDDDDDYGEYEKEDDFRSRIEEFIARNIRKWKEEHFNDKLALVKSC